MKIKKFNESLRDQMTPKNLDEVQQKIYNFIEEMKEKEEEEYTGEDITKIFNLIKEVKGVNDEELLNILLYNKYITPSKVLFLIQSSLFNSNKQDPWHYYEPKHEEVDEDEIDDLLEVLKNLDDK